ncbi:MAG: SDR family oxidoreductase [Actinomycetota bacterium]
MELDRWNRALITGASSGIGDAFARLLASLGTDLVVVARNEERLQALATELSEAHGVDVEVLVADLSKRKDVRSTARRLKDDPPIDLLINNAGLGYEGTFTSLDPKRDSVVVDVNMWALHQLTHAAAGTMEERGQGGIINVSSVAGFGPAPGAATYAATKAFVTTLSQALHDELSSSGVTVSCLCPGLTRTEFHQRAEATAADGAPDAFWQTADEVARAGLEGLARRRAVVVPGAHNKAYAGLLQMLPTSVTRRVGNLIASVGDRN